MIERVKDILSGGTEKRARLNEAYRLKADIFAAFHNQPGEMIVREDEEDGTVVRTLTRNFPNHTDSRPHQAIFIERVNPDQALTTYKFKTIKSETDQDSPILSYTDEINIGIKGTFFGQELAQFIAYRVCMSQTGILGVSTESVSTHTTQFAHVLAKARQMIKDVTKISLPPKQA